MGYCRVQQTEWTDKEKEMVKDMTERGLPISWISRQLMKSPKEVYALKRKMGWKKGLMMSNCAIRMRDRVEKKRHKCEECRWWNKKDQGCRNVRSWRYGDEVKGDTPGCGCFENEGVEDDGAARHASQ